MAWGSKTVRRTVGHEQRKLVKHRFRFGAQAPTFAKMFLDRHLLDMEMYMVVPDSECMSLEVHDGKRNGTHLTHHAGDVS